MQGFGRLRTRRTRNPWSPPMARRSNWTMIEAQTSHDTQEAIMRWLGSNWFFILFIVGMVWMHVRHGGHGSGRRPGEGSGGVDAAGAKHGHVGIGDASPAAAAPHEDVAALVVHIGDKEREAMGAV